MGRRRSLDDEQPLADDRHIERLFARFIAALREFLGDAVEARPLSRDHPRRLAGRRGEDVAELRAAALEADRAGVGDVVRSEEHTSELQSLMRISYAVFCLKKKKNVHILFELE